MRDHLYSICSSVCIWMFTTRATIYRFTKFKISQNSILQKFSISIWNSAFSNPIWLPGIHKLENQTKKYDLGRIRTLEVREFGLIFSKLCQIFLVFPKVQCNVCVSLCTFVLFLSKNRVFSLLKKIIVWQQFDCFFEIVC